jgi:hypothetical protein
MGAEIIRALKLLSQGADVNHGCGGYASVRNIYNSAPILCIQLDVETVS